MLTIIHEEDTLDQMVDRIIGKLDEIALFNKKRYSYLHLCRRPADFKGSIRCSNRKTS